MLLTLGIFVGVVCAVLAMVMTPLGSKLLPGPVAEERIVEVPGEVPDPEVVIQERVVERRVEVPAEPPEMPDKPVSYKKIDVATLFNGIQIKSELQSEAGGVASVEREVPEAFQAYFELRLKVPTPNQTIEQLAGCNEHLPNLLTDMGMLVDGAGVSKYFYHLYDLKQRQVQANVTRLEAALSRHNFYDCDTVLELTHPETKQRAFFLQGEMDVVADGSDGDRMPEFPQEIAESSNFQATTSYGWKKLTKQPNPLIEVLSAKLKKYEERYKVRGLTRGENAFLEGQIGMIPKVIEDLKYRSFLLAEEDPFVVIPMSTRRYLGRDPFIPKVGDYAVVIYGNKLYPAIVGDYGPTTKVGEASLRIAKELNSRATPYRRPVSDLSVSYLVFPGSAEKPFGQPNLAKWHARCGELLERMGG
ncbi:MAG: glycoside hydrolase family 75 protein, partial [Verrucomicrobiales bacterium]|nr:glycoside hydrolase family 75 protein [Verrucomicrobiales bacterium]